MDSGWLSARVNEVRVSRFLCSGGKASDFFSVDLGRDTDNPEIFRGLPQSLVASVDLVSSIRARPLLSISFPIHGLWILPFRAPQRPVGSGDHPASYPMDTVGSSPAVKQPGREANHSLPSSAVWDMKCLRPPESWGRGLESQSRHGCLSTFNLCWCCPVQVAALRRADSPPKESYGPSEKAAKVLQRTVEP
jgi:hypothetical protein